MADVQPFRAWRYDLGQVGSLADVTAPPYDVIGPDQQRALYERHPCNVVRLILNRPEPGDPSPDEVYSRAATFLRRWQREGILTREHENTFYVHHQSFEWEGRTYERKGFLGALRLEDFGTGSVYPHELTMPGPKADRLKLLEACKTNLSPIFGLFPDLEESVQTPLEEATAGVTATEVIDDLGVKHRLWPVTDEATINTVRSAMAEKPIFIADGHHRYETACTYRRQLREAGRLTSEAHPANFVLMHFVGTGDPGLVILPTHRLVSGLPPLTVDDVRSVLGDRFETEEIGTGESAATETWERMVVDGGQNVFGFGTPDGQWLFARLTDAGPMATLAPDQSDDWRGLGVSLLHRFVLEHLFFAERYPDSETRCRYVHRLDEVTAAQTSGDDDLACLVMPATMDHVQRISERFERMPPKSTYFYPKLLSGLVFHPLE